MYRLPKKVVHDYHSVFNASLNWDRLLDQYAVSTIVLDRKQQSDLFRQLRINHENWSIDYQDSVAVVARRVY